MSEPTVKEMAFGIVSKEFWLKRAAFRCPDCGELHFRRSGDDYDCRKCGRSALPCEFYSILQPLEANEYDHQDETMEAAWDYLVLEYINREWIYSKRTTFAKELKIILSTNALGPDTPEVFPDFLKSYRPGDYARAARKVLDGQQAPAS